MTIDIPDVLHFNPDGTGAGLYTERIDLKQIGTLEVVRASEIEFNDATQQWEVFDYTGRKVHADPSREACLAWERQAFNQSAPNQPGPLVTHHS